MNSEYSTKSSAGVVANTKKPEIKREFVFGSVVSINGNHLDPTRWKSYKDALILYCLVKSLALNDSLENGAVKVGESLAEFVIAGKVEGYNRNRLNTIKSNFSDKALTIFPVTELVRRSALRHQVLSGSDLR